MTETNDLLAPAAALILWTCLILLWLMAKRLPAMKAAGIDLAKAAPGGRGADLDPALPNAARWPSHNYTHLLEQPTLFYAVVAVLAIGGGATELTVGLAWAYTALRIAHSVWQISINRLPVRFALFFLSSLCLIALSVLAVVLTLG